MQFFRTWRFQACILRFFKVSLKSNNKYYFIYLNMKQRFLLTIALLCAVAQGAWAQRVVDLSTISSDYEAQDGDVLTGNLASPYNVIIYDKAKVTLMK